GKVRRAFSSHAGTYEEYARVQARVVDRFCGLLPSPQTIPLRVLDVGVGTGMLLARLQERWPAAVTVGLDLAFGMAQAAAQRFDHDGAPLLVCADGEQLPFADATFDLVVSTSTYQWLPTLDQACAEAWRVLTPGGTFCFALFGARTLWELKDAYRRALALAGGATHDRTHRFLDLPAVAAALSRAGFRQCELFNEEEQDSHVDVPALLRSLKRIGAGNAAPSAGTGLAGRRLMVAMMEIYQREYARRGLIPATYEVIYGKGQKSGR
ncbi:MAG TPA: methyltransferase domain-containing protein, partial [Geobacteraceae bacterium]